MRALTNQNAEAGAKSAHNSKKGFEESTNYGKASQNDSK
jgi:hypothetical protein